MPIECDLHVVGILVHLSVEREVLFKENALVVRIEKHVPVL